MYTGPRFLPSVACLLPATRRELASLPGSLSRLRAVFPSMANLSSRVLLKLLLRTWAGGP